LKAFAINALVMELEYWNIGVLEYSGGNIGATEWFNDGGR